MILMDSFWDCFLESCHSVFFLDLDTTGVLETDLVMHVVDFLLISYPLAL